MAEQVLDRADIAAAKAVPAPRGRQYESIQALRFLAAFTVVVTHSSFYTVERLNDALGIYTAGANGVRLFFVISGFVMILSSGRLEGTPLGWRAFALRRIVRIIPIYWAINAIKLAILLATPGAVLHAKLDWIFILKSLLFIPAINVDGEMHPFLGVGWTLNFEMFFYLLFTLALIARVGPTRFLAPILVGMSLLYPVARAHHWPIPLQFWADPIVLDFLAGMILARLVQRGVFRLPAGVALLLIVAGLIYLFGQVPRIGVYGELRFSLMMTLASLAVVAGAVAIDDRLTPFIPKAVLFMGGASYALYLIHPIVAPFPPTVLAKIGLHMPMPAIVASIVAAMIAGALAYRFIEEPVTAWFNGWMKSRGLFATTAEEAQRMIARRSGAPGQANADG